MLKPRYEKLKLTMLNTKVTDEEREEIERLAKLYAGGNVSLWLREAAMKWRPTKKDLAG
jgi:hypothetical protein